MEYNFKEIELKWQQKWKKDNCYKVEIDNNKPKFYILDMFPYPSGAGLHVGHPLGYIASDIYSRYKRHKGFNVLHPMGYDAFGLPAEQYAIQTGQHPALTTEQNIKRYRDQLDKIGFSFDWSREVNTSKPDYYKWTQWAWAQMFEHYYNAEDKKTEPISKLVISLVKENRHNWNHINDAQKENILQQHYRLAYQAVTSVNWCEELGTVLANDEVKDGLSVRGGFPVEQKPMKQWLLRVTAYAERLLKDLDNVEWSDSLKEIQRNWIGRSEGATMFFQIDGSDKKLEIFTTRADTVFGVTFMVMAPEHKWINELTTPDCKQAVENYIEQTQKRSERERIADTKNVSGCFTGAYAINPLNGAKIPIYISEYVLAGYGTGAIMAVPAHDSRDYAFAKHFDLPIVPIIECDVTNESYEAKQGILINSDFLNGLDVKEAIPTMLKTIEDKKIGFKTINYRLRDAIFSRQRYWGEPIPVCYKDGVPQLIDLNTLPLELPQITDFSPTKNGEPPLARVDNWETIEGYPIETSTMPGFAGSSAYYLRYMDPNNNQALVSKEANEYWENVDLYVGGIEHATGHLIYSRFWNKFLFDTGHICKDEPFKKLVNQGMIQGRSNFVYRVKGSNKFVSASIKDNYDTQQIHVDVNIVKNDILDTEAFKAWLPEYKDAEFILDNGKYTCDWAVEKMSKSMYNVVNPDMIIENYGADTLRMYEMFLGPLEQSKPWDTNGIDGVHKFLRKLCRVMQNVNDNQPTPEELKILHKTIKKVSEDIENFSFNTAVSAFMICLNELSSYKTFAKSTMKQLIVLIAPFAPYVASQLWEEIGEESHVITEDYPVFNNEFLVENEFEYPVSFNGKMRFKIKFATNETPANIQDAIKANEQTLKYAEGKDIKKIIVVPNKIINIVI